MGNCGTVQEENREEKVGYNSVPAWSLTSAYDLKIQREKDLFMTNAKIAAQIMTPLKLSVPDSGVIVTRLKTLGQDIKFQVVTDVYFNSLIPIPKIYQPYQDKSFQMKDYAYCIVGQALTKAALDNGCNGVIDMRTDNWQYKYRSNKEYDVQIEFTATLVKIVGKGVTVGGSAPLQSRGEERFGSLPVKSMAETHSPHTQVEGY